MKKLIVWSSVAVLMLSTLNVYAGPKFKKIKNPKWGARVSRVTAEMLRKGELRYAPEHTPRLSERAEHTTTAPSSTVQRPNLRDVQDGTISPRLPSGGKVQGVHVGTSRSTPELSYRNHADIPTRVQAAKMLEDAKLRSEQKGDPNILVAHEVEVSFARHKREQLSEKLNNKVQELRSQDKSASSEEISKHYDELRAQEMERYSDVKRDILERYIEKEEIKAYDELDGELNIHLDALDRINEAEIAAREKVAENPDQFSTSFQQREAEIAKQRLYLADEKLELDWRQERLDARHAELMQRFNQLQKEQEDLVAKMETNENPSISEIVEQAKIQRDYELVLAKFSELKQEFDQINEEMDSFQQGAFKQYREDLQQLDEQEHALAVDKMMLLTHPARDVSEGIPAKHGMKKLL